MIASVERGLNLLALRESISADLECVVLFFTMSDLGSSIKYTCLNLVVCGTLPAEKLSGRFPPCHEQCIDSPISSTMARTNTSYALLSKSAPHCQESLTSFFSNLVSIVRMPGSLSLLSAPLNGVGMYANKRKGAHLQNTNTNALSSQR